MIPWIEEKSIRYEFGYKKTFFEGLKKDNIQKVFFILTPSDVIGKELVSKTAVSVGEISKNCKSYGIQPIFVFNMRERLYNPDGIYCIPKSYDALKRLLVRFGEGDFSEAETLIFNQPILEQYREDYLIGFSKIDVTTMFNHIKGIIEREEYYRNHFDLIEYKVPHDIEFIKKYDFCYSGSAKLNNMLRECYLRSRLNKCPFIIIKEELYDIATFVSENSDMIEFDKEMERYCKEYSIDFILSCVHEYFAGSMVDDIKECW